MSFALQASTRPALVVGLLALAVPVGAADSYATASQTFATGAANLPRTPVCQPSKLRPTPYGCPNLPAPITTLDELADALDDAITATFEDDFAELSREDQLALSGYRLLFEETHVAMNEFLKAEVNPNISKQDATDLLNGLHAGGFVQELHLYGELLNARNDNDPPTPSPEKKEDVKKATRESLEKLLNSLKGLLPDSVLFGWVKQELCALIDVTFEVLEIFA